jgi:hypothetical protein
MAENESPDSEGGEEQPRGRVFRQEITATVGTKASIGRSIEWATSEIRLAILGIVVSVALGAASIGLVAGGWIGGLIAGLVSALLLVAFLKIRWLRNEAMRFARWIVSA